MENCGGVPVPNQAGGGGCSGHTKKKGVGGRCAFHRSNFRLHVFFFCELLRVARWYLPSSMQAKFQLVTAINAD
jgi:hypothetical protein